MCIPTDCFNYCIRIYMNIFMFSIFYEFIIIEIFKYIYTSITV